MAAAAGRVYVVSLTRVSVTGAITLIQLKTGAQCPAQILRVTLGQSSSTTSTQLPVQLNRKVNSAATVTSFTPLKNGPITDPAAAAAGGTSATGVNASAEGTDGDILKQDVWNYLNGWMFLPSPKEPLFVDAFVATSQGLAALKLPVAPASGVTLTADLVFEEMA